MRGQNILAARTRQLSLPSFLIRGKECFLFSTLYCLNCFTLQANLFTYTTFLYLILLFYLIPHHRNKKSQLQTCTHISNNIHISPLNIHALPKGPISTSCFMNPSYHSILIFSPIIQTIFPSLSFQHMKSFIKSIFKYLNELNTCSKYSKLLCLPFLAFFPLLYFFLSIEWKTHIMSSVYLKAIIQLQNFSAGGHEGWFLIEKVFLINFVFQWKKKYTSSFEWHES